MHFNPFFTTLAVVITGLTPSALGFWRLPCRGRLGTARIDPLVNPGEIAPHAHVIHGGSNFDLTVNSDQLRESSCTSCGVVEDKSVYWTPGTYFQYPNGTTELVGQVGGMLVYYELNGKNIQAFPKGFRMLAGDANQRNFTLPFPDPPSATWSGQHSTQFALSQKAIGFNCLNYNRDPEPALYRHTMPSKEFLDENCADGVRMEVAFPSCWNGRDLDSPDHRSHVAYPSEVKDGACPEGFEKRIVVLFYETIWDTYAYKGVEGRFLISNGDPTGCGYHADFIEGWNEGILEQAVNTCTDKSGMVESCPLFTLQDEATQQQCKFNIAKSVYNENCYLTDGGLPGNMAVHEGPAYASSPKIEVPAAKPSPPPSPPPPPAAPIPSPAEFYVSPADTNQKNGPPSEDAGTPICTTWRTEGNVVYEHILVQVVTTTTVGVPADSTPTSDAIIPIRVREHLAHHRRNLHGHH
ncbi:hypothetical protein AJ80_09421 [Polytolypa hystricis UAMH7299]|uniref:DUF1996 domain-containing protein n=1 Tax=Polytolypa hystricis (strain UAMH7299) TaxID=1447883 RepID=A0A2B7WRB8_POLH7|nr:hypothetical protein AJ80_09421 [Polytolypa hystricis UAMH7299]